MRTRISLASRSLTASMVVAIIGFASCNDNATTEGTKTDTSAIAPATIDTMPKKMDNIPTQPIDTGKDTKVPRN